jgi:hypothetical protein
MLAGDVAAAALEPSIDVPFHDAFIGQTVLAGNDTLVGRTKTRHRRHIQRRLSANTPTRNIIKLLLLLLPTKTLGRRRIKILLIGM